MDVKSKRSWPRRSQTGKQPWIIHLNFAWIARNHSNCHFSDDSFGFRKVLYWRVSEKTKESTKESTEVFTEKALTSYQNIMTFEFESNIQALRTEKRWISRLNGSKFEPSRFKPTAMRPETFAQLFFSLAIEDRRAHARAARLRVQLRYHIRQHIRHHIRHHMLRRSAFAAAIISFTSSRSCTCSTQFYLARALPCTVCLGGGRLERCKQTQSVRTLGEPFVCFAKSCELPARFSSNCMPVIR